MYDSGVDRATEKLSMYGCFWRVDSFSTGTNGTSSIVEGISGPERRRDLERACAHTFPTSSCVVSNCLRKASLDSYLSWITKIVFILKSLWKLWTRSEKGLPTSVVEREHAK